MKKAVYPSQLFATVTNKSYSSMTSAVNFVAVHEKMVWNTLSGNLKKKIELVVKINTSKP